MEEVPLRSSKDSEQAVTGKRTSLLTVLLEFWLPPCSLHSGDFILFSFPLSLDLISLHSAASSVASCLQTLVLLHQAGQCSVQYYEVLHVKYMLKS